MVRDGGDFKDGGGCAEEEKVRKEVKEIKDTILNQPTHMIAGSPSLEASDWTLTFDFLSHGARK